jgi:dynein heavy chain
MQELNKLYIQTEIQKKMYWEQDLATLREGAYVFGF